MITYSEEMPLAATKRAVVVTPTLADVERLMADVRQSDRDEWVAFTGLPMRPQLEEAIRHPALLIARASDRYPLCMFGAHELPPEMIENWTVGYGMRNGLVWFAGTNKGYEYVPDCAVLCDACVRYLHSHFHHLIAYSDARNHDHHQWLVTLGFDLTDYRELGPWSLPFWQVERWSNRSINECVRPLSASPLASSAP